MKTLDSVILENEKLSQLNFITLVGDWLSFFAMLSRSDTLGYPAVLSGFVIPLQALARAFGAATVPRIIAHLNSKGGIVVSQAVCLLLSATAFIMIMSDHFNIGVFFVISVSQTLVKQVYDGSKETHSKNLSTKIKQRGLQAQVAFSQYGAQFVGPVIAFVLIILTPIWVPLGLDILSFIVTVLLALQLSPGKLGDPPVNILRPIRTYLWKDDPRMARLRRILISRATLTWTGFGLFNYLVFDSVAERFGKDLSFSTWTYVATGLGGTIASTLLKDRFVELHKKFGDGTLCFIGHIGLVVHILSLALAPSLWIALAGMTIGGIGMGLNMIGGQTARRETTTSSEFPEIVGLEIVIGQLIFNFGACALAKWTISNELMTSSTWIYIGAACFAINGVFSLSLNEPKADEAMQS